MATPEEERAIRAEINQLIRVYIDLLKQAGISQDERNRRERTFNETLSQAGGDLALLNDLQSDLTIETNNTSAAVRAMGDDFEGVATQLGDIVTDLGNTGDLGRKILSTFKSLRSTTDKIRDDRDLTRVLSEKQLKSEKENLGIQQKRLDREITRGLQSSTSQSNINKLRADGNNLAADALISLKTGNTITENQLEALRNTEGALIGLSGKEKERVLEAISFNKVTGKTLSNYTAIEAQIEKALQREKQLTKNMGLTSSIVEGLGKLPGLNRVFRAEDVEEVKNLAREALVEQTSLMNEAALLEEKALAAREAGNNKLAESLTLQAQNNTKAAESIELTNRGSIASKLLGKSFSNLKDALTDPAAILTAIGTALLKNSQLTNQFQSELGASYGSALAMRNELNNAAGASGDLFINSEKLQKSFFGLADTTGVFFDLSSKSAETFTNLTERIGLAGAEAGNLTMLLRLQGKDTETTMSNLVGTASAALATSKSTASVKQILGDVASSSKGLQASFAANPGALAKAAVAARELGASLKDIEGIQKSLLDFEGSISAELEAELLTGKQLNLEKARTAALNNDLEGVSKELSKQGVDLASFGKMNVIQQEAMAKAMGLSRDTMGDMLLKQQTQNMTADEVRKKFGDQTYEQFKALSAQDKFNAATAKLKDLFGSVMTALTPIIDGVAMLLKPIAFVAKLLGKINELTGGFSNGLIGVAIAAKALGVSFGSMFNPKTYAGFFKGLISRIKGLSFSGIGDKLKGALAPGSTDGFFKGLKDKFKGLSSPLKTLGDKLKGAFGGAADASKGIQFDPRMAGGGRFRDMASGRMVSEEAANAAGVFKPGTGPASAAASAASGATDAASTTGATPAPADDGKALKKKMQNIAEGIKSFANTEVIKGALSMIVAAPGLIALGLASIPLKITEKINGKAIQAAMKGIAKGVAAFANPQVVLGGLALIPVSLALATMAVGAIGLGAIALLGAPAAAGMAALTAGLTTLGAAAATGVPFLGVALIGAFGAALIPFGLALGLAAPAIEAIGTVIATTIMAIADAVVTVMPAITQGLIDLATQIPIANLLALAVALPSLAFGLGILGGALLLSAPGLLIGSFTLPLIGPAITQLGDALKGIDTASFFQFGIGMTALTAAFAIAGAAFPLIIGGSLALSVALTPLAAILIATAPSMKLFGDALTTLSNIDYSGLLNLALVLPGFALSIGMLGGALLLSAPGLLIGSLTLPLIAPAITRLGDALKGIDTASFFQFGIGMAALTTAFAMAGVFYPLIIGGSFALSVALIPLTTVLMAAAPAMKLFGDSLTTLSSIDYSNLLGLATALPALAIGAGALALATPAIFLSSLSLLGLGLALTPLSNASEGLSTTSNSLIKISEAINALDIGKVTSLATAMGKLTLSLLGLAALGPLASGILDIGEATPPTPTNGGALATTSKVEDTGVIATTPPPSKVEDTGAIAAATPPPSKLENTKAIEVTPPPINVDISTSINKVEDTGAMAATPPPSNIENTKIIEVTPPPINIDIPTIISKIADAGVLAATPPPSKLENTESIAITSPPSNIDVSTAINKVADAGAMAATTPLNNIDVSTAINKVADAGVMAATSVTGGVSPIENPQVTTIGGETNITSNTPGGETNIANNTSPITSPNPGEDMRTMIEETVASTINALVPEMVASLKEGQGNVKVTNDNFNASSQGQLPDQIRNISNNNFA